MKRREAIFTISRRFDVLFLISAYLCFLTLSGSLLSLETKKFIFGEEVFGVGRPHHMALIAALGIAAFSIFILISEVVTRLNARLSMQRVPQSIERTSLSEWIDKHCVLLYFSKQTDSIERSSFFRKRIFVGRENNNRPAILKALTECRIAHEVGHCKNRDHLIMWMYICSIVIFLLVQIYIFQFNGGMKWHFLGPINGREALPSSLLPMIIGLMAIMRFRYFLHRREFSADLFAANIVGADKYLSYLRHCQKKAALKPTVLPIKKIWKNIKHPNYCDRLRAVRGHAIEVRLLLAEATFLGCFVFAFYQNGSFAIDAIFAPVSDNSGSENRYGALSLVALAMGTSYILFLFVIFLRTVRSFCPLPRAVQKAFCARFFRALHIFGACLLAWWYFTSFAANLIVATPSELKFIPIAFGIFFAAAFGFVAVLLSPLSPMFVCMVIFTAVWSLAPVLFSKIRFTYFVSATWLFLTISSGRAGREGAPGSLLIHTTSVHYEGFGDYVLDWTPYLLAAVFSAELVVVAQSKISVILDGRTKLGAESSNASGQAPNSRLE